MSSPGDVTATQGLARWAHALALEDIPPAVQAAAVRHLLDGLGTTLAAVRAGLGAPALTVALGLGGPFEATVLGTDEQVSAPAAALVNGARLHALDFDDTHAGGLSHATAAVLPAAFAVGQKHHRGGAAIRRAAVAGYETVTRVTGASPHGFHARGLHATQIGAVFSSALVTGLLGESGADVLVNAMGIAGSAAGGLLEFLNAGSSNKQLHPGMAAMNGIIAARLAAAGASGPAAVLEGDKGLFAAMSARPADIASITGGLGSRWETVSIGIKPYPACQLLHNALDAARSVLADVDDPSAITRIVSDTHPDSMPTVGEPRSIKISPRSEYDARFSVQWCLAAMLLDGAVTVDSFTAASIARPEVAALAGRVELHVVTDAEHAAHAPGRVEIRFADGRLLVGAVPASRGTAAAPMTDDDVIDKFIANCGGSASAPALAELVLDLASLPDLDAVAKVAADVAKEPSAA
jgi:2-methylcitrate dehydratase PrpD